MGCGCGSRRESALDLLRTIAGVCAGCSRAEWRRGIPIRCTIDGESIAAKQHGRTECPLGKFPRRWSRVRWLGVTWLGVPWPVRLYRGLRGPKIASPQPGCGCMAGPKLAWLRACRNLPDRELRRWITPAPTRALGWLLGWAYATR